MSSKALFVEIQAAEGKQAEVTGFLKDALAPVRDEPDTRNWYALRFDADRFAIFDTFPDQLGRLKHLFGQVGRALLGKTVTTLDGLPDIAPAEILAQKSPLSTVAPRLALYVPLEAKAGQEEAVAAFLKSATPLVEAEPGTLAWYALRFGSSSFAIVDVFPDEAARQAHLTGKVAAALMANAAALLATAPDIRMAEVLASKLAP